MVKKNANSSPAFNVSQTTSMNLLNVRMQFTKILLDLTSVMLPLESVVSVLACIMMVYGNPSNGRRPAAYFYLSTSGLVGKWL